MNDREELSMNGPRVCPTCGTDSIEPTFQYATLSVSFGSMPCTISGLHAYRCNNAHFFIVFGNQGTPKESEPNERGSSLFL